MSNCKRNISLALHNRPQLLVLIVDVQVDVAGFHVPSALLHLCAFVSYIGLHSVPTKFKIAYNITLLCNHASTVVVIRSCSMPTPILIILHWHSSGMVKATASWSRGSGFESWWVLYISKCPQCICQFKMIFWFHFHKLQYAHFRPSYVSLIGMLSFKAVIPIEKAGETMKVW